MLTAKLNISELGKAYIHIIRPLSSCWYSVHHHGVSSDWWQRKPKQSTAQLG